MNIKKLQLLFILLIFFSVIIDAKPDAELRDGYYVTASGSDSIQVESSGSQLTLSLENGSRINFNFINGKYQHQKVSSSNILELNIENDQKFGLLDNNNSIGVFTLYDTPSFFNKLIAILVSSALLISIFQAYLKLNKIWKRRKIEEVAYSISIVASLLGFAVLFPFLMNSLFITNDYPAAGKSLIGLFLAALFSLISIGYFVESNREKGLIQLLIGALSAEKSESTDLLSAMMRPHGARKIIDILTKLAAIDDDIAQEEIDLIEEFAERWRIDIPTLKVGKPEEITNLVELKALVQSYLDEKPDLDVASNLVDLISMMAEADDEITEEEAMAVGEFTGMISHYINAEEGGTMDMFEVAIVPQNENQIQAVKELMPDVEAVDERGGTIFKVGLFYSEEYANAVCSKYISLGLFTNSLKVVTEEDTL